MCLLTVFESYTYFNFLHVFFSYVYSIYIIHHIYILVIIRFLYILMLNSNRKYSKCLYSYCYILFCLFESLNSLYNYFVFIKFKPYFLGFYSSRNTHLNLTQFQYCHFLKILARFVVIQIIYDFLFCDFVYVCVDRTIATRR